jgi:diacylglycerol kinase family enzyme
MSRAEMCVIYNPAAGFGWAAQRLESLKRSLAGRAEFWPSLFAGHAEELAALAVADGFPIVGAAGGDGTIHEIVNGLLRNGPTTTALAVFPIGSANDYAHSLGLEVEWWRRRRTKVEVKPVDVGVVRSPDGRQRYFINTLGLGFSGSVNLESRRVHRLRGLARYVLALIRALISRFTHPKMKVTVNGETRTSPTLSLSVALGQREGNFKMSPNALLDDGLFDYLHAGPLSRWDLMRHFPDMIRGTIPTDHPHLWLGRCREMELESEAPLIVHIDGEFFCLPEEDVRKLEVEILPGRLLVQARVAAVALPIVPQAN